MHEKFQNLINHLCVLVKLNQQARIVSGEPFCVNEVMFTLIYESEVDDERVFLFAQFGDVPSTNVAEVLAALLRNNHLGYLGDGPGFSISPTTNKVNYCRHLMLSKTEASALANFVAYLAGKALEWRRTYFLGGNSVKKSHFHYMLTEKIPQS